MNRVLPDRALDALRSLAEELERIPTATEIVVRAKEPKQVQRFVIFERTIIREGGDRTYQFARAIPHDGAAEDYLNTGEKFIQEYPTPRGVNLRWHECEEGQKFKKLLDSLSITAFDGTQKKLDKRRIRT